jgi:hypothetical protein
MAGLVRRRAIEADMFTSGTYSAARSYLMPAARPFSTGLSVVQNVVTRDTFFSPRKTPSGLHLGTDIFGPDRVNFSLSDPMRGLPVYAAINTRLSSSDLNNAEPMISLRGQTNSRG